MFIMSPVIIKALGNRDYGLWELVMSVIGYMGLLDLGIGPALVRFISVADGENNRDDLQRTISTAMVFFIAIGMLGLLCFLLLSSHPGIITGNENDHIAYVGTVFLFFALDASIVFPMQVFITTLMGVQRHYCINITRGILLTIRAVLTYHLLSEFPGKGLLMLALLEPIFNMLQCIVYYFAMKFDSRIPGFSLAAVSKKKMKDLFVYGVKSSIMMVASRLQNASVPFIISNVIGIGNIIYFVLPNRLVDYARGISQALGFPLIPHFGAAIGRGDQGEMKVSWLKTTLALQLVAMAMPLFIFFNGEAFLGLWIGQEYAQAGRTVMYCLLVGLLFEGFSVNSFRILMATSQHGKAAVAWLILSLLSIPLGVGAAYVWGVFGVAFAVTVVSVLGNIATLFIACRVMGVSLLEYVRDTSFRLIIPLVLLTSTLWLMKYIHPVQNYMSLIAQSSIALTIYILSVWKIVLDPNVRKRIFAQVFNSIRVYP
jgi:O-antigen/teichoic acid export membrane protein